MKLFIRFFTGILSLVLASFAVFGTLFFQSSFSVLLERETEANVDRARLITYALLTSVESVQMEYTPEETDFSDIMETLSGNFAGKASVLALYDASGLALYQKGASVGTDNFAKVFKAAPEAASVQKVVPAEEGHLVLSCVRIYLQEQPYILAVGENIEYLYEYRGKMYRYYCMITCAVILLSGLVAFALAYHFAKPIRTLSKASVSFARGAYNRRIKPVGNDELTEMMRAFNFMAGRICKNMEELSEAARRQEEFTGAFAHELKTPLTSIIGYSDMLATMELSEEERVGAAKHIYRQGKRLERLSHSMLMLCSLDGGECETKTVSLRHVVEEARRMTEYSYARSGICCTGSVEEVLLAGDADLLVVLVGNLLDNARKACAAGGRVEICGAYTADGYELRVKDNGCGIPPEDIEKVKEAFFMVDKSRSRKQGGAGLGLTLCSRIAALHDAALDIESERAAGTTVTVRFLRGRIRAQGEEAEDENG